MDLFYEHPKHHLNERFYCDMTWDELKQTINTALRLWDDFVENLSGCREEDRGFYREICVVYRFGLAQIEAKKLLIHPVSFFMDHLESIKANGLKDRFVKLISERERILAKLSLLENRNYTKRIPKETVKKKRERLQSAKEDMERKLGLLIPKLEFYDEFLLELRFRTIAIENIQYLKQKFNTANQDFSTACIRVYLPTH